MKNITMKPVVGMGVTRHIGSDKYAGTITRVSKSGKTFWYTEDKTEVVSGTYYEGNLEYKYTPEPNAREHRVSLRKDGVWREDEYSPVTLGVRKMYLDPSF